MKKCSSCKNEKDLVEFSKNARQRDGLCSMCKTCNKDYQRLHYQKNADTYKQKAAQYERQLKNWLSDLKSSQGCKRCGESHPACLDFHHEGDKEFTIAEAMRKGVGKAKIMNEITKCVVLCANCHRKLHWEEMAHSASG